MIVLTIINIILTAIIYVVIRINDLAHLSRKVDKLNTKVDIINDKVIAIETLCNFLLGKR